MTRSYFLNEVCTLQELIDLNDEYGLGVFGDSLIPSEDIDGVIEDDIREFLDYNSWEELRDVMSDLYISGDYFFKNGTLDYSGIDDGDFTYYIEEVLSAMDDGDLWDAEDDEEEAEDDDPPCEPPIEDEEIPMFELFSSSAAEHSVEAARIAADQQRTKDKAIKETEGHVVNLKRVSEEYGDVADRGSLEALWLPF